MEHTKWKVCNLTDVFTDTHPLGKGDIHICDCNVHRKILETDVELPLEQAEANARRICRCVNAHDTLLEACREAIEEADSAQSNWACVQLPYAPEWTEPLKQIATILEQAIAKAESK